MRKSLRVWFLVTVGLWVSAASWAQSRGTVAIAFEDNAVAASGLSPGKSMVWFGVERLVDADYSSDLYQHYKTDTVAADGTARFTLDRAVAAASIWVAVDLDTGAFGVEAPASSPLRRTGQTSGRLSQGAGAAADQFLDTRTYVLGLAVRPGQGAWLFGGGDGGPRDLDKSANNRLSFALDEFDALPGSPAAPAKAGGTDLWFVIDPRAMEIAIFQPLAGGKPQ
ncbi:MAG TPA: hypothetical protein VIJ61_01040 [Thermoanaerobaculia bacterium]